MAAMTTAAQQLLAVARVFARAWWRSALVVAVMCILGAVALWAYAVTIGPRIYAAVAPETGTVQSATAAALITALPLILLFAVLGVAWAGAVNLISDRVQRSLPVSTMAAVREGLARCLVALGIAIVWLAATLLTLALTPLLVIAGLAGLVILAATRRNGPPSWLPSPPALLVLAIPLAAAAAVAVRLSRALPAAWVDRLGVRASLRSSWASTRGKVWASGFVLLAAFALVGLATLGAAWLAGNWATADAWGSAAQIVIQAVLGSVPVIALAVLYRSDRGPDAAPTDPRLRPRPGARTARIAGATAAVLVIHTILLPGPQAPAEALEFSTPTVSIRTAPSTIVEGNEFAISIQVRHATEGDEVDLPTGTVSVTLNGAPVPGAFSLDEGNVSVPYPSGKPAGNYTVGVTYNGDSQYGTATNSLDFTVASAGSLDLTIDDDSLTFGDELRAVATISLGGAAQGGTVAFIATPTAGAIVDLGTETIDGSGNATLTTDELAPGDYTLTAVYQGDAGGNVMSSPGRSLAVAAINTETTATLSPTSSPGAPSAPGGTVTATVNVTAIGSALVPQGTIEIYPDGGGDRLDSAALVNGQATLHMVLPPGAPVVQITYVPGTGFYGSYTTEQQYVGTWSSALGLSGAATSAFGDAVQLTATATSTTTPTGSVDFYATPSGGSATLLGSAPLNGEGVATFNATGLNPGDYAFTAEYPGDGTAAAASSAALNHSVGLADATVALTVSGTPTYGDTATAQFQVTAIAAAGTPTGVVAIYIDDVFFGNVTLDAQGKGGLNLPVLLPGEHQIRASYGGNSVIAAGQDTQTFSVTKATPTVVLGGALDRSATYGDSQVYTGSVTDLSVPVIPTGTVQLWADGYIVGTGTLDAAGNFSITTTTIPALGPPARRAMVAKYLGDSVYEPAQSSDAVRTEVDLADANPVVTLGPGDVGIGGTYTLKATLPSLGAGATGTVTFHVTGGADIGPIALVGGAASTSFQVTQANTYVTASYSGDANFTAQDSAVTHFTADRSAATVQLTLNPPSDPNVFAYGNTFELVAKVAIAGGLETDGLVTFKTTRGITIAANVPTTYFPSQGIGVARVTVCAGDAAGCPVGTPALGLFDQDLVAIYPEGTLNLAATSASVPYALTPASTSTSLVVNPTSVQVGSAIYFTATVANTLGGPKPSGLVSFYGVEITPSGPAEAFIGSANTDDGVAVLTSSVGSGVDQLRWPASQVIARFYDVNGNFSSSSGTQNINLARAGTSVTVTSTAAVAGSPSTLTATIAHVPGYSANYTGQVQFFLDGSSTPACSPWITGTATAATCSVTWATGGNHTVVAKYLGDVIYAPSDSAPTTITVTSNKLTPQLAPQVPGGAVALTPQTVTWTPGSLTGTVTVFVAGGSTWCTVPVSTGTCSGSFANGDAGLANLVVRYLGDANYDQRQYEFGVPVTACRVVDVRSSSPSRGTVTVSPAPSCGNGGYPVGTTVTATANALSPNAFLRWRGYTQYDAGMVTVGTAPTTTLTVTNDTWTWTRIAEFAPPCYVISPQLTGAGMLYAAVAPNCTTLDGARGYERGTTVTFNPLGLRGDYGVPDVFYSFGTLPSGATTGVNSMGHPFVTFTAMSDAVVPVVFGPRCVQVTVTGDPTNTGDAYHATTAPNCFQPNSPGYLPKTAVEVSAASGKPELLVGGWTTSQANVPTLPAGATATLTLGTDDVTLTANWVACYPVALVVDAPTIFKPGTRVPLVGGAATLSPAPNCPDGSGRFLSGTVVTGTPSIAVAGVIFRGWDGDTTAGNGGLAGVGELTGKSKTVTVTGPTTLTASFYQPDACSRLSVVDPQRSVTLAPTGCGEGYYADQQKITAAATGDKPSDLWQDKYRSSITVTKKSGLILDVYASVRGDASTCFGSQPSKPGPQGDGNWRSLGPLKNGPQDCLVGGNISMRFEQCQTLSTEIAIVRRGDTSGTRYTANDLPNYLLVPTTGGNFTPLSTRAFDWIKSSPVEYRDDEYVTSSQPDGACKDAGNAFQPDLVIMVSADSVTQGITFDGWTSDASGELIDSNPAIMQTTDTRRELPIAAAYTMACYHVTFGEGITIEGEAPRCPGYADEDNMFIAGAGIQIRAAQHVGKRTFGDWTSGVLAATTVVDAASGERTAIAYVNGDMAVTAKYPTEGERWENGFANAGKLIAGVVAVVAPVALGVACPPCGIALAVVGVAGAVSSLIPGGDKVADFFSLINPTKITECGAYWAFGKETGPTGSDAGDLTKTASGTKKIVGVIKPPPTAAEIAAAAAKGGTKTGKVLAGLKSGGKVALQGAAIGYGLYSAGIANADLGFETTQQLRDTRTMTACLDEAWKFAS